jgi:hypothetical protein
MQLFYGSRPRIWYTVRTLALQAAAVDKLQRSFGMALANQQHRRPEFWTGGHGTFPYEQNTQQSPGLGLSIARQPLHS